MHASDLSDDDTRLAAQLVLEEAGVGFFRGHPGAPRGRSPGRVFGGLLLAQALVAAARTSPGCAPHSLHAHFLSPARYGDAIEYEVEHLRDGVSFDVRSVTARQGGEAVCRATLSFSRDSGERGHDVRCPELPGPENLPEIGGQWGALGRALELRLLPTTDQRPFGLWMRPRAPLPDDAELHAAAVAYASDGPLVAAAAHAQGIPGSALRAASLDHALWIHGPTRFDDWHVLLAESPVSHAESAWAVGGLYDRSGARVASVAQGARVQAISPASPSRQRRSGSS